MLWVDHSKVKCPFGYQSEGWGFLLDAVLVKLGDLADGLKLSGAKGDILSDHSDFDGLAFSKGKEATQLSLRLARELQVLGLSGSGHKGISPFDSTISASKKGVIDFLAVLGGHQHLNLGCSGLGLCAVFIPNLADADCVITRLADGHQLGLVCVIGHGLVIGKICGLLDHQDDVFRGVLHHPEFFRGIIHTMQIGVRLIRLLGHGHNVIHVHIHCPTQVVGEWEEDRAEHIRQS